MRPLNITFIYKFLITVLRMVSFYEKGDVDTQLYGLYYFSRGMSFYYTMCGKKKIG